MKSTSIMILTLIIIIVIGGFVFANSRTNNAPSNTQNNNIQDGIQKINLGMKDYNYYPDVLNVNVNQPVEITLDKTVSGCLRSFTIKEFGVNKYSSTPADKITFTPNKKGTFSFSCSMGMAYGKMNVN